MAFQQQERNFFAVDLAKEVFGVEPADIGHRQGQAASSSVSCPCGRAALAYCRTRHVALSQPLHTALPYQWPSSKDHGAADFLREEETLVVIHSGKPIYNGDRVERQSRALVRLRAVPYDLVFGLGLDSLDKVSRSQVIS